MVGVCSQVFLPGLVCLVFFWSLFWKQVLASPRKVTVGAPVFVHEMGTVLCHPSPFCAEIRQMGNNCLTLIPAITTWAVAQNPRSVNQNSHTSNSPSHPLCASTLSLLWLLPAPGSWWAFLAGPGRSAFKYRPYGAVSLLYHLTDRKWKKLKSWDRLGRIGNLLCVHCKEEDIFTRETAVETQSTLSLPPACTCPPLAFVASLSW